MNDSPIPTEPRRAWWREYEIWALAALVVCIYFSRLTTLTIRGEESRRARVACEILESGDWIVPRQQGQIYLSRPPLGSWPIALAGKFRGEVDLLATRLPTALATLLMTLVIYVYGRNFLSPLGALAAGAAYATMGQVLELGRLAETEATFTLLVSGSLLVWHAGYQNRWSASWTWIAGYSLAALAGLAKGPQGPVYFAAPVIMFLLLTRDWRSLFSLAHLCGIAAFAVVLGAWQIPYLLATDLASARGIWLNNAAERFTDNRPETVIGHLLGYPLQVLGAMLPWSPLLLLYGARSFRHRLDGARPYVYFLATAIAVTLPSVWLATGAKSRYFMPLYPAFALLAGLVVERAFSAAALSSWRRRAQQFLVAVAVAAVVAGVAISVASAFELHALEPIAQPLWFAGVYLAAALATAVIAIRVVPRLTPLAGRAAVLATACFMGITYTGVVLNAQAGASEDTAAAVANVKALLPADAQLVSLGRIDHLFAYHYRDPIVYRSPEKPMGDEVSYFCFNENPKDPQPLGFAWKKIAVVSLERNQMAQPNRTVVIGCREDKLAKTATPDRH